MNVSSLHRYPIKSCRGENLTLAVVEPWGLAGDRRLMLVDFEGVVVTAREHPRLLLVDVHYDGDKLRITDPGGDSLRLALPAGDELLDVRVWRSELLAAPVDVAADAWFSALLGKQVRLVYLDDPTRRRPNPDYSSDSDRVSFADGYPLLLVSEGSLQRLNELIAEGPRAHEGPLPMTRFRPNLVLAGATPWAEDGWRRLRVGDAVFRAVKACDRCVMTTFDPLTAAGGKEPIATLARHRRWDGKTWFGVNLIPDTPGAVLSVGDDVEILDQVDADGPLRTPLS